jgi:hypothetical protein
VRAAWAAAAFGRPGRLSAALLLAALLGASGALAQGAAPAADPPAAPPPPFDPLQGMDPSGRIPRVPLPEDLNHPERWRYIPEGRIKPGNVIDRLLVSSFVAPQFFFQEDVGTGAGLALTDIDFREQRRREFLGAFLTYTTEGQQRYRLVWRRWLHHVEIESGGVALEERTFVDGAAGYEKTLTRRFFGLGPDTREGDETSYTDEVADVLLRSDHAIPEPGDEWIVTVGLRGEHHNLARGRVSGAPSTEERFPGLVEEADGYAAVSVLAGLRYDTRDSQRQPFRGWRVGLLAEAPLWQSTGDTGAVLNGFASLVVPVPPLLHRGGDRREEHPPTDTVAVGLDVAATVGDLPFFARPSLGGSHTLRGYIANRFTDDAAWHAVAEYRFWVIPRGFAITRTVRVERVGLALFGEAGSVAGDPGGFLDATVHTSYGVGLRISLERTAVFRVDVGFSGEGPNVTANFGLSF